MRRTANSSTYLVLEVCSNSFDCETLRQLSLTSKATRAKVKNIVQQHLPQLLHDAAEGVVAAAAGYRLQNTDWPDPSPDTRAARGVMAWLLRTAGRRALNQPAAAEALMQLQDAYHHRIAEAAVGIGFNPTFQQILAAAKNRVQGVEQWVKCMPAPKNLPLWNIVCRNSRLLTVSAVPTAVSAAQMMHCSA
jgi:hypothetical protein